MKIALVAPSPIPFVVGGAEKLWWGMLEYINKHTTHHCELIKIPTKENSFWNLIDSYYKFYKLNLDHFDMVISTKYPAWMVQHPNHILYMQHCLRGLYDTYHFTNLPTEVKKGNKKIDYILSIMEQNIDLDTFFIELFKLKNDNLIPLEYFNFPGPFIKKVINFLDKKSMQNIKRFFAISQTVIDRKEYFPPSVNVIKNYHPSNLEKFKNISYDYFFTVSRIDNAKRVDILVKAYLKSNTSIPLKIAGTGPMLQELKELAKDDNRIEFLGFVSDDDLIEYYARAFAVFFGPYDEDYGLITIEAMMSSKAVITFSDSGGVLEFVEDKQSGLICNPDIEELTKIINFLSKNPQLAVEMGKYAKTKVKNITWQNTINRLINQDKITVVTTYPIYPPRGGGQNRIFYLYKEIAKEFIVDIICLDSETSKYQKKEIAPNLFEIRVPKTKKHAQKEWEIEKQAGIPVTDIALIYLHNYTPQFKEEIINSAKNSKYIVCSHPYSYELLEDLDKDIIYESHNVEYTLKQQMLKNTKYNQQLLSKLYEVEKKATLNSKFVTICAKEDAKEFNRLFNYDAKKAIVVPNGVDLDSIKYLTPEQKLKLKSKFQLENEKIVIFIGSWHQPNIEAVEIIFNIANDLKDYKFIIIGSVKGYFENKDIPQNVGFTGIVTNEEKEKFLSIADVAINPMISGSGTNLKMLDYMASGIPVVSTKIGARGLNIPSGYIAISAIENFPKYIKNIKNYTNIEKSKDYVNLHFSWKNIAKNYKKISIINILLIKYSKKL